MLGSRWRWGFGRRAGGWLEASEFGPVGGGTGVRVALEFWEEGGWLEASKVGPVGGVGVLGEGGWLCLFELVLALTRWLARDLLVLKQVFGWVGNAVAKWGCPSIRCQCFVSALLGCCLLGWYWVLKMVGLSFLGCFCLFGFRFCLVLEISFSGYPLSLNLLQIVFVMDSLIFRWLVVLATLRSSPLMIPLQVPGGWADFGGR